MGFKIYNFCLPFLNLILQVLARFLPKIHDVVESRRDWRGHWQAEVRGLPAGRRILFHVASVGELEQVRPVIDAWRKKTKDVFLLSYFSPSVERVVKDFSFVDAHGLLPLDFPQEMADFVALLRPSGIVLNRYELWPNFFREARRAGLPLALVNASVPPLGVFGKLSLWMRAPMLKQVRIWGYVDTFAAEAWEAFVQRQVAGQVTGDPRMDRALERVEQGARTASLLQQISDNWDFDRERLVVAGSTWGADEKVLADALVLLRNSPDFSSAKMIIVPHEPTPPAVADAAKCFRERGLRAEVLSRWAEGMGPEREAEVLIVDRMGVLAELYALAAVTYVGGGFGRGIHSIIEPVAHGVTVAFGPHYGRVPEAKSMIALGAAWALADETEAAALAVWLQKNFRGGSHFQKGRDSVAYFIQMHRGAGERTANFLAHEFQRVLT